MVFFIGTVIKKISNNTIIIPRTFGKHFSEKVFCCTANYQDKNNPNQKCIRCFADKQSLNAFVQNDNADVCFERNLKSSRIYFQKSTLESCNLKSGDNAAIIGMGDHLIIAPYILQEPFDESIFELY